MLANRDAVTTKGPSAAYAYYVVLALTTAYMLSFVDRVLISLMIDPIRNELGLGDTQIGLLVGFGFVLLYSIMGIPFGSWADSGNRRNLVVFGLVGWSAATAFSGLASGFAALLAARALVGIGEATLSPAAYSTIADRFDKRRLGFAISLYAMGLSLGGGVAMAFGGYLVGWASETSLATPWGAAIGGWRLAFIVVGLLGIPLALLMLLTVREAPRRRAAGSAPPLGDIFRLMKRRRGAFIGVLGGYSVMVIASFGPLLWAPVHFGRAHGMSPAEIGASFGFIVGGLGTLGLLAGGLISDRLSRRGMIDAPVRVVFWAVLLQGPLLVAAYLLGDRWWALAFLGVGMCAATMMGGLQAATLQLLVPESMRGRITAIYLLCANMTGMGLGPLIVGALSEHMFPGAAGVGQALALVTAVALGVAAIILTVTRGAIRDAMTANEVEASGGSN